MVAQTMAEQTVSTATSAAPASSLPGVPATVSPSAGVPQSTNRKASSLVTSPDRRRASADSTANILATVPGAAMVERIARGPSSDWVRGVYGGTSAPEPSPRRKTGSSPVLLPPVVSPRVSLDGRSPGAGRGKPAKGRAESAFSAAAAAVRMALDQEDAAKRELVGLQKQANAPAPPAVSCRV